MINGYFPRFFFRLTFPFIFSKIIVNPVEIDQMINGLEMECFGFLENK